MTCVSFAVFPSDAPKVGASDGSLPESLDVLQYSHKEFLLFYEYLQDVGSKV